MIKSNQEIIDEISKIVEPYMKFNLDDIYGDRGGIPYPQIEKLDMLHFKFIGKIIINKNKENEMVQQVKMLDIGDVEIVQYNFIGKFMVITLDKYHNRIINKYNDYLDYKNKNAERINEIYQYLNEKVPEEFVGWYYYNNEK